MIARTDDEIRDQECVASDAILGDGGACPYPSMSYTEGVRHALAWVLGDTNDAPMDDD